MNACVVTTINYPTPAIEKLHELFGENLIIVADKKTPQDWNYKGLVPINNETKEYAPDNHYAKKNLGYLEAMRKGATCITDTDDDNTPNFVWKLRDYLIETEVFSSIRWANVYKMFSNENIWPRGLPLNSINDVPANGFKKMVYSSIQQGLADNEPDVDALWRILFNKQVVFLKNRSVSLQPSTWCPFNSQSTWWFAKAFPLMYLPVTATFRMCDIWRSFIAQRCLWEIGETVTFHSPAEVYQDRNEHDLLKDFEDEIPGYLLNDKIVRILSDLTLKQGEEYVCENMLTCYDALVKNEILPYREILSVTKWIRDYETIIAGNLARVS